GAAGRGPGRPLAAPSVADPHRVGDHVGHTLAPQQPRLLPGREGHPFPQVTGAPLPGSRPGNRPAVLNSGPGRTSPAPPPERAAGVPGLMSRRRHSLARTPLSIRSRPDLLLAPER